MSFERDQGTQCIKHLAAAVILTLMSSTPAFAQCSDLATWNADACQTDLVNTKKVADQIRTELRSLPTCSTLKPAQEANCAAKRSNLAAMLAEATALLTRADLRKETKKENK